MAVTVRIPTQLRELSGGASEVDAEGGTVAAVLDELEAAHPGFGERLFDDSGELRRFVTSSSPTRTSASSTASTPPSTDGQTVSIVPAVAGG